MPRLSPQQREEIIQRYCQGEPSPALARDYGISIQAVCGLVSRRGIARRTFAESARRYTLNEQAFTTVTDESAYWIGFLMANGTILDDAKNAAVLLGLAEVDRAHLERFRLFLQATRPITREVSRGWPGSTPTCRLAIYSQQLVASLRSYGLAPNKSGRERVVGLERNRHFWRGVVDGDGYIGISNGHAHIEIVGGAALLQQFLDFLGAHLPAISGTVRPHKRIHRVGFSWQTAEQIIRLLYAEQSIALERKQLIAQHLLLYPA